MSDINPGLAKLREPFPAHQISKLPKPTRKDAPKGRCQECGGYHGLPAFHLDYVGHAALTDRLLDADPAWTWEPLSIADGLPVLDPFGGMWIKLTVCGITRLGYGHAGDKQGGDAIKEIIGDALRNAAMRFGAALDLWHKGDLHKDEEERTASEVTAANSTSAELIPPARLAELAELSLFMIDCHGSGKDLDAIRLWYAKDSWSTDNEVEQEERKLVWSLLKNESKLRSAIKANKPDQQAA